MKRNDAMPEQVLKRALRQEFSQVTDEAIAAAISRSGGFLGQAKTILEEGSDLPPQTEQFLTAYAARNTYGNGIAVANHVVFLHCRAHAAHQHLHSLAPLHCNILTYYIIIRQFFKSEAKIYKKI